MATLAISLGNAYSAVACIQNSEDITALPSPFAINADIVVNAEGDRIIPTMLTRTEAMVDHEDGEDADGSTEESWHYGTAAKQLSNRHSDSSFIHLINNSCPLDSLIRRLSKQGDGDCKALLTRYLASLREMAENSLGVKCERAVLTVPDTLVNDWISEAAKAAGFIKSTRLIDQSMAALFGQFAATYATPASVDKQAASSHSSNADSNFLIIDCGASSVKLSLIARRSGVYLRLSHKYLVDGVCTGEAVDAILFDYFRNEFQRKTRSELTNRRSKAKLWLACEQLKKTLSKSANAFISVDSLQDGMDFHSSLHQLKFESLINPLLSRLASEIEEFLGRPVVGGAQAVDQVVLVGGMARLPKIEQLVRFFFPQFTPAASGGAAAVDPQEVFALGAACEVPYLDKGGCDETTVTGLPFTIGIRVHSTAEDGNQVSEVKPVVHKHHPLPLKQVFELEVLRSEALLQLVNSSSGGELIEEFYLDGIDPENPTVQCVLTVSTEGVVALDFSQD